MSQVNLAQVNIDLAFHKARIAPLIAEQHRCYVTAFQTSTLSYEIYETAILKLEVLETELQNCRDKIRELRELLI